jgi:four helix bundle protein
MREFDFERLEVFNLARQLVVAVKPLARRIPSDWEHLANQLRRSATSIPLNIAEGAGEWKSLEKARFYRYSRRSATETAATLSVCECLEFFNRDACGPSRELLLHIVPMLTGLVQSQDRRRA